MKKSIEIIIHHSEVSEKVIEKYLTEQVRSIGGLCLKYFNPNIAGCPDRLVLLPHGKMCWVELKSKGKKPTKLQTLRHRQLTDMGFEIHVVSSRAQVDELVNVWRTYR